jgi:uncharacterized protein (TIGR02677 family)
VSPAEVTELAEPDDDDRSLFRYVTADEWRDYRRIMALFADTFFAEMNVDDVARRLAEESPLEEPVLAARLEQLRKWGNLTVSSATGTPTSLADYYRRRSRYLITQAGQQVHHAVEQVLARVDEVGDVSTGRLRALYEALRLLAAVDVDGVDTARLADMVEAVFDPHEAFTSEITQFFTALNQWQSRYDLSPGELSFFAQVLVGYVTERLDEIERLSRPIGAALRELEGRFSRIAGRAGSGLAARVDEAGMAIAVRRAAGSRVDDWEHLARWFVDRPGCPARLEQLRRDAVSAIRTLTLNLTRLSRVGLGASSRRSDLLRLARFVADVTEPGQAHRLVHAALGMHRPTHLGVIGGDGADPVPSSTAWADAPPAEVPVALRERGDRANRGQASPMTDRAAAQRALLAQREQQRVAAQRVDTELLAAGDVDGSTLSAPALARLQQLVSRTVSSMPVRADAGEAVDGALRCELRRAPGSSTTVSSPDGTLTLQDLQVRIAPVRATAPR